ncbi:chitin synthase [Sporodiniella umbellata]|nr:chitin synthase [Sporodiniella umbellata]
MGFVGFLTFGFTQVVCPRPPLSFRLGSINEGYVIIHGWAYLLANWNSHPPIPGLLDSPTNVIYPPIHAGGKDASFLFQNINQHCTNIITPKDRRLVLGQDSLPSYFPCQLIEAGHRPEAATYTNHSACHRSPTAFATLETMRRLGVKNSEGVYVLNLDLLSSLPRSLFDLPPQGLIESMLQNQSSFGGQDITHRVTSQSWGDWRAEAECLLDVIKVGEIDTKSVGCMTSDIVLYTSLIVILGVILVKFFLAVVFGWCLSWKLGNFKEGQSYRERMRRDREIEDWTTGIHVPAKALKQDTARKTLMPRKSRFTQPDAGSMHFNPNEKSASLTTPASHRSSMTSHSTKTQACPYELSPYAVRQPGPEYKPFGFLLAHTICLVTCYSEGEDGLRTTLDSIATTDYPNSHKLILVIADGMITGHGNALSTPDICISMMQDFILDPDQVEPYSYLAIADGTKRHNMAKIYTGYYRYNDSTVAPEAQQRVPMITIVKCGTPEEQAKEAKPGNRGKRDSQVILMSFLQKTMFNERMTELEYEFFANLWRIAGVSPDKYEIVLMVDADTKVYTDALSRLVSCMVNDPEVMGLCGETKIGNKTDSWVSMIQVFEYYISHHQSKAFESIFGNVTCLPGCFCMYRIKAPKGNSGHWVPILANPDIIEHYSENVVDTLHKKNLLLLGEDRYLSTLMLRTFPRRKMLFVPQAVCKTVVPDSFLVLLSQRRRWINSTIHNLMELVFVRDLCGTFCFSMQFVVFMELVGTLALPAAISFTLYLIVLAILGQPAVLSLILLALILGLPAVLIMMTSRKLVYVCWMIIYLFSLPIWNFVLPTYAYWHFDDFTWGETRKVQGEGKDSHGDKEGEFDSSKITMKKWTEYEQERKHREARARSEALVQQHLAKRWVPADLSINIDQSTLSNLIGSSLSDSKSFLPSAALPSSSPSRSESDTDSQYQQSLQIECISTELPSIPNDADLEESWRESVYELSKKDSEL